MRAFFAQIDWIRNTFFFVFYFFMVIGVFLAVVKPQLDIFRKTNAQYRKELYVQSQVESQRDAEMQKLINYQNQNARTLRGFEHQITQREIEEKLRIIFENVGVVADGTPILEGKYLKQRFVISGRLQNIHKLKEALKMTQSMPGIVRFNFPIHIEREGAELVFSFRLDAYFLNL
ncbi:hypothetical protein [Helicobacter sp. MIT 05-5294]|uniref:hypothetical protein n=1 Tax=Helicobacter sp. MIT 05-5294 TaxID=1548150 RepID=UPI00051FE1D5|nr:hypothetical protein [Helicobacter sp. MIT 05-5294]TLD86579.1 hypothetical protein LS69_006150 [Helicobacter sp. MIT 05-5294]